MTHKASGFGFLRLVLFWFFLVLIVQLLIFVAARWTFPNSIIFTQGLMTMGLTSASFVALIFIISKHRLGMYESVVRTLTTLLACLTFYSFLITIPTLLDRSISIFLLAELDSDQDQVMTTDHLSQAFMEGYVDGVFQVEKRIAEQVSIGNFERTAVNEVRLTRRGEIVASVNRFLANIFRVDSRYTNR